MQCFFPQVQRPLKNLNDEDVIKQIPLNILIKTYIGATTRM